MQEKKQMKQIIEFEDFFIQKKNKNRLKKLLRAEINDVMSEIKNTHLLYHPLAAYRDTIRFVVGVGVLFAEFDSGLFIQLLDDIKSKQRRK